MTNQGPATPGTAARCETLTAEEIAVLRKVFGEPLEPESWHDGKVLRLLDERERLKAENASLLESLRAAENEIARLRGLFGKRGGGCIVCGHPESDHYSEAEDFFCSVGGCECTEIGVRLAWKLRAAAAEQRNTELEGALRPLLDALFVSHGGAKKTRGVWVKDSHDAVALYDAARAALHDEERRQGEEK